MTGAERARASRERRKAVDEAAFRESERRRGRDYYARTFEPAPQDTPCAKCGELKSARGSYCSKPECVRERNRVRMVRYMHERRARLRGNVTEAFDPKEVYERDGWVCGICSEPVDRDARFPDPASVSLDHIIPVSWDGPHTRANTRCAHLGCNSRRGNRVYLGELFSAPAASPQPLR